MGTITFGGLSTGLNTGALIDELVRVERQPITLLESKQAKLKQNVSLLQDLISKLSALKSAATKLSTVANFFVKKATGSNETVLDVSAGSNADVGNHTIIVNTLARASTVASASFADTDITTVGMGTLRITVGTTITDISVDGTNNTLQGLRDAINDSGAAVTASIILENAGASPTYRLAVTGKDTGTVNAVSFDTNGLTLGGGSLALGFTTTQAAQDAALMIDGIAITRATNTISDAITGITLDVKSTSASPIQVTTNNDTEEIKKQLNNFVTAYNEIMSFIATQTKYDSNSKTAAPLIGNATVISLQRTLQRVLTTPVVGTPSILAEIGIATQRDGTVVVDDAKLTSALQTNLEGVSNLFLATTNGVAQATVDFVTNATRSGDGILSTHITGTQDRIRQIDDQIARKETNLDKFRENLIRRFSALETLVSQLQTQGNFLAQHLSSLNA
ncbi:MAG: flagellar filament capping protein FliD [Candidatus Binatia bacterium]